MLQDFLAIFRNDVPCQNQIKKQNQYRMMRAWVLHSLKTVFMGAHLYFDTPYWKKEANLAFPNSGNEDLRESIGSVVIALLISSVCIDLVIW